MTHQGQSFNFQKLTAIYYLIEEDLRAFALEGPNYEDSVFKRENKIVAIGEAKYIKSKKNWTSQSLFFQNEKGPLIQLWERDKDYETLILFSFSGLSEEIKNFDKINIPKEDLEKILQKMKQKPKLKRMEHLSIENLLEFLDKILFKKYTITKLEELIIESLRAQDIKANLNKLNNFASFIDSDNYTPGDFISRDNLFRRLKKHNESEKNPLLTRTFREYYKSVIKLFRVMDADMKSEDSSDIAFMFIKKRDVEENIWNLHRNEEFRLRQRIEELTGTKMESDYVIHKWGKTGKSGIYLKISRLQNLKNHNEVIKSLFSHIQLIAKENGISTDRLMIQSNDETLKDKLKKCYNAFCTICNYYFQKKISERYENVNQNQFIIALKLLEKFKDECLEHLAFVFEQDKSLMKYFGSTNIKIIFDPLDINMSLNNSNGLNPIFMNINGKTVEEKSEIDPILKKLLNRINES